MHAFKLTKDGLGKGLNTISHGLSPSSAPSQPSPPTPAPNDDVPSPPAPALSDDAPSPPTSAPSSLTSLLSTPASLVQPPSMHAFTDGLKLTKDSLGKGINSLSHGLTASESPTQSAQPTPTKEGDPQPVSTPASSSFTSFISTPASIARSATTTGLAITSSVARAGLDTTTSVVSLTTGTASLAGTALSSVITSAAQSSGAVFEPVGSGLKALKALEGLELVGEGVQAINGLSLGAVRKVSELTSKALDVSGKTPTFFDPDADGTVRVPDTTRGLSLLGLDPKIAAYAAYALHSIFSYPTSDAWIPTLDKSLPIHVKNMPRTRWGKNWGNFERIEWVDDVEIDKFFLPHSQKALSDYWKQGRQGFGILLLIFEWGTTWPFYMPPLSVPIQQIPFADDIGTVVRKAILPTIISNFKQARALNPHPQTSVPGKLPEEPINMPGEFKG